MKKLVVLIIAFTLFLTACTVKYEKKDIQKFVKKN